MKKISLVIALLLFATPLWAGQLQDKLRALISTPAATAVTRSANFNSDENPLATNWSTWSTGGNFTNMRAQSGVATAEDDNFYDYAAYWDSDSFGANQFSAAKGYGTYFGVVVRVNGSSGYLFRMTTVGTFQIYKMPDWVKQGDDYTGVSFTDGQVIRLEATGTSTTTLTPYVNGSALATRVDSSSAIESGAVGIYCSGDYSVSRLDDWTGGEL